MTFYGKLYYKFEWKISKTLNRRMKTEVYTNFKQKRKISKKVTYDYRRSNSWHRRDGTSNSLRVLQILDLLNSGFTLEIEVVVSSNLGRTPCTHYLVKGVLIKFYKALKYSFGITPAFFIVSGIFVSLRPFLCVRRSTRTRHKQLHPKSVPRSLAEKLVRCKARMSEYLRLNQGRREARFGKLLSCIHLMDANTRL